MSLVIIKKRSRRDVLEEVHRLGFNVVAFTTTIKGTSQLLPANCPEKGAPKKWFPPEGPFSTHPSGNARAQKKNVTVLERVTLVIDEAAQLVLLTSPLLTRFDIVAVQPGSEKVLQQCLQFDFDVISVCLSRKQQFYIKKPQANVAAEKGVMFEISYADALRDRVARRHVVSNACALSRATGKKNIILSSGAKRLMELRGPHDMINLGMIFDLPYESGRHAVTSSPQRVASHGDVRANTYKGIVRVVGQVPTVEQDKVKSASENKSNIAEVNDSRVMTDI